MSQLTQESFRSSVEAALEHARAGRDALLALPQDSAPATVLLAFDSIGRPLDEVKGQAGLYTSTHPDAGVREAAEAGEQALSQFATELSLDRDVFDRLVALELPANATSEERRLLKHTLRDYRRSGVDKDEITRKRIRALQEELVEIGQEFDRNIAKSTRTRRFPDGKAALVGMPEDYVAAHPEDESGAVTLSTDPPDVLPLFLFAERGDVREVMHREFHLRAWPENGPVLERLLEKRHELAGLLGYDNWADYITEDKMVRTGQAAREFIEKVVSLARPRALAEYQDLLEEKRRIDPDAASVELFEQRYLTELIKRRRFEVDSQEVRGYFAYEKVKQGVFATSEVLYGVRIVRNNDMPVWHEDVECWDLIDTTAGEGPAARFYLDMFPREGKFKHAAMFDVRYGLAGEVLPEAALVCNFPRPSADDPALLLHSQVTTFFHEFGHLLHHLFGGRQRFLGFSGISCEWDFVEVPSQLYEEWAWDAGVLQEFATHHETGDPIPAELVQRLRSADEYGKGLQVLGQMVYASLSLQLYSKPPAGVDVHALLCELRSALTPFEEPQGTHMEAGFGHLNGYSAIYYTYMWSLVIAKDLFGAFERGPMDQQTADRYRQAVLAPGGSQDAADLVRGFLGRSYDFGAWESWLEA